MEIFLLVLFGALAAYGLFSLLLLLGRVCLAPELQQGVSILPLRDDTDAEALAWAVLLRGGRFVLLDRRSERTPLLLPVAGEFRLAESEAAAADAALEWLSRS